MAHMESPGKSSSPEPGPGPLTTHRVAPGEAANTSQARPAGAAWRQYAANLTAAWFALGLLAAWEILARLGWIPVLFFPAPSAILKTTVEMALSGRLWPHLGISLYRLLAGVLLGAVPGLLLGLLMGWLRPLRLVLDPWIAALHPLPKLAMFPIVLIIFGIGESSKIVLLALAAFFPMLINTLAGVRQIDQVYWEVAASYGAANRAAPRLAMLHRILLPGSLPVALAGLRLALNSALVVGIAVEMLSARQGLGAAIWLAWQTLRTNELYAILLVTMLLGLGFNRLVQLCLSWLAPWHASAADL